MIEKIDYVEFYVGNALQTALFYQHFLGFELVFFKGLQTGCSDCVSYVVRQNDITLVITSSLDSDSEIARHVNTHGDAVKKIAFSTQKSETIFELSIRYGAEKVFEPTKIEDENGFVIMSSVKVYSDIEYVFIDKDQYRGGFLPSFDSKSSRVQVEQIGLTSIDHITANVEKGTMDKWINFYKEAFNFELLLYFDDQDILTEFSAMKSKVVVNHDNSIKFPITEPVNMSKNSQIQEFLDYNRGSGIQHLAFNTMDIRFTVDMLKKRGLEMLTIPKSYYINCKDSFRNSEIDVLDFIDSDILLDKEADHILMQAFTKPILDRPTYFVELIQRNGSNSFGKNNVKALYSALIEEQQSRGNL